MSRIVELPSIAGLCVVAAATAFFMATRVTGTRHEFLVSAAANSLSVAVGLVIVEGYLHKRRRDVLMGPVLLWSKHDLQWTYGVSVQLSRLAPQGGFEHERVQILLHKLWEAVPQLGADLDRFTPWLGPEVISRFASMRTTAKVILETDTPKESRLSYIEALPNQVLELAEAIGGTKARSETERTGLVGLVEMMGMRWSRDWPKEPKKPWEKKAPASS